MAYDLVIKQATIIDGTGNAPYIADIGIQAGQIAEIGNIADIGIDAKGQWLTPGFIDIHTHFDGQASWDETLSPSIYHGVTTVVMGNCGVGFAPLRKGDQDRLIRLMEGVEDIPGVALATGIDFCWETFPEYMRALEKIPHSIDYALQIPHDPVRMYVMGDRAVAEEQATPSDIKAMRDIVHEALKAGAIGFSTGRTDNHRTSRGEETPASEATRAELTGIAEAFNGISHGVVQVVSDFDLFKGEDRFDEEFDLVEALAETANRPLSMTWLQRDPGGEQFKAIAARVDQSKFPLYLQTAARGIGVINGLDASFHPFIGFPSYKEISHLPLADKAKAMRDPARRLKILSEKSEKLAGDGTSVPPLVDILLSQIERISARMFPLQGDKPNYEPSVQDSFYVRAMRAQTTALAAIYDYLSENTGENLIYFPIFNYNEGTLDVVRGMFNHEKSLMGLSDAGAHVGVVCDAGFPTFMMTHWTKERGKDMLRIETVIHMLTQKNATYLGLKDRGVIKIGMKADFNLIDPEKLALPLPEIVADLPGGAKRFIQKSLGYNATYVSGECVIKKGEITNARPGKLVRAS
jgi:N-acyl-D-aspartate/D-glutamate deacylase